MSNKIIHYTVGELINELKQFPQDLPILVGGYEDGFENILEPKIEKLEYESNSPYYSGEFQEVTQENKETNFKAIVLRRVVRNG